MSKAKELLVQPRIIILLAFILLAVFFIHPLPYNSGVTIQTVARDSGAALAGIESPKPTDLPMNKEKIIAINKFTIKNTEDYYSAISKVHPGDIITIDTNKDTYAFVTSSENNSKTISSEDLGLSVIDAPKANIKKGLDLQGGTRVLLQPERELDKEEMGTLIDSLTQRLNIYGLSDIVVREAGDLSGNQYVLIEIAGLNEREVKDLITTQGKFEAKIGNKTVFSGGNDVKYVCRSVRCSGIPPRGGCSTDESGKNFCRFHFAITLSPEAAQRQADATKDLDVIVNGSREYLSKKLELYLDDELVDELSISSGLRGEAQTQISISGSGSGETRESAREDAIKSMNHLQTVLITGSLPVKLSIAKIDALSPVAGEQFTRNAILVGLMSLIAVSLIVFARYRKLALSIPMVTSMASEVIIILGFAAFIKWNLDLAAIAGIIISVGTGVDDLIVFADGVFDKESRHLESWEKRRKNSFFIIMAAYFTTVVAMLPLVFAGAGLLRGFALTTITGISIGVFITRPAYATALKILFGNEEENSN